MWRFNSDLKPRAMCILLTLGNLAATLDLFRQTDDSTTETTQQQTQQSPGFERPRVRHGFPKSFALVVKNMNSKQIESQDIFLW